MAIRFRTAQEILNLASDKASVTAQLAAANEALLGPTISGTKKYSFDAGTGRMEETFLDPFELNKLIESLIARRDLYQRKTDGRTNMSMGLNRC